MKKIKKFNDPNGSIFFFCHKPQSQSMLRGADIFCLYSKQRIVKKKNEKIVMKEEGIHPEVSERQNGIGVTTKSDAYGPCCFKQHKFPLLYKKNLVYENPRWILGCHVPSMNFTGVWVQSYNPWNYLYVCCLSSFPSPYPNFFTPTIFFIPIFYFLFPIIIAG